MLVEELSSIHYTLSPMQPVFFIKVNPACGVRLRERLKMSQQSPEYFDPGSIGKLMKRLVIRYKDKTKNLILHTSETSYLVTFQK